jgi:hypothetical protein
VAAGALVAPSSELLPTTAPVTPWTTSSTTPTAAPTGPFFGSFCAFTAKGIAFHALCEKQCVQF